LQIELFIANIKLFPLLTIQASSSLWIC